MNECGTIIFVSIMVVLGILGLGMLVMAFGEVMDILARRASAKKMTP